MHLCIATERAHHLHELAVLQSFNIVPKNERCSPAGGPCSYTVTQQVTDDQRSLALHMQSGLQAEYSTPVTG